jgi:opacity protein-like surface antigen
MRIRNTSIFVLGAVATLALNASAQVTRSTKRIPITKESKGEVIVTRVDTVLVPRTDTLRMTRVDTVYVTRVDTVRLEPPAPVMPVVAVPDVVRQIGGFYFGLAAGAALPTGDLDNAQRGGFHFDVPFGWDPIGSPLGVRFDGSYSRFDVISQYEALASNPTIMQLGGDLKLRLPVFSPWAHRFQIYGVGGASWNRFKDIVEVGNGLISVGEQNAATVPVPATVDHDWHSKWGWNAGGGVQFGFGRTNLFVESRVMKFNNRVDLQQVPIVLGLSWY